MTSIPHPQAGPPVQRQIVLPTSKAVEIAYKNIRMRLSRSLLVTSGIVLALAFLMAIQSGEQLIGGMRNWISATRAEAPFADTSIARHFAELRTTASQLQRQVDDDANQLRSAAGRGAIAKDAARYDPKPQFGMTFAEIEKNVGKLPTSPDRLAATLAAHPPLVAVMQHWVTTSERLSAVKQELKSPEDLQAAMTLKGVPTTPDKVAAAQTQTHWLLGLALLVAFVGILNAMLMSVTERFREIGTMKCLGALDSFIIKLFLIESLFQGVVGTLIGVGLGLVLSLADAYSKYGHYAFQMIPVGPIALSALVCFLIGVILTVAGAVYPAWQAARMQPIEAMRVET
jgi:cell division protein FtsX